MDIEKILRNTLELNIKYKQIKEKQNITDAITTQLKDEFTLLSTSYPAIFKISISDSYNFNRLKQMLLLANKVHKNEMTEHDASVKVGTILVDDIVKPQLNKK
jgi:hypothetical protein